MIKRVLLNILFSAFSVWSSSAFAANCISGHAYASAGNQTCTVPAGVTSITGNVWGNGTGATAAVAGGGGGFCGGLTLTVTPGATIYMNTGSGHWFNISANSQPTSSAQGCYTSIGAAPAGGTGTYGTNNYTGGAGFAGIPGGGGGGAGSGGNGGAGTALAGGTAGTPDGGAGGNPSCTVGAAPNGGGGILSSGVRCGATIGQVVLTFAAAPINGHSLLLTNTGQ